MKKLFKIFAIAAAFVLPIGLLVGCGNRDDRYNEGREYGYSQGRESGYAAGRPGGYNAGREAALTPPNIAGEWWFCREAARRWAEEDVEWLQQEAYDDLGAIDSQNLSKVIDWFVAEMEDNLQGSNMDADIVKMVEDFLEYLEAATFASLDEFWNAVIEFIIDIDVALEGLKLTIAGNVATFHGLEARDVVNLSFWRLEGAFWSMFTAMPSSDTRRDIVAYIVENSVISLNFELVGGYNMALLRWTNAEELGNKIIDAIIYELELLGYLDLNAEDPDDVAAARANALRDFSLEMEEDTFIVRNGRLESSTVGWGVYARK